MGGMDFFGLISEGAELVMGLDESSPNFFASLDRIREILSLIGVDDGRAPDIMIGGDKDMVDKSLTGYLDWAFKSLPEWRQYYEMENILAIAQGAGVYSAVAAKIGGAKLSNEQLYDAMRANAVRLDIDAQAV